MGGESSSSSSQSTSYLDERFVVGEGGIGARDNASVYYQVIDAGTVNLAKEMGLKALTSSEEIARLAIEHAGTLGSDALGAIANNADKAFEFVDKQRQDTEARAFSQTVPWLVAGASVVAISMALRSK